jgi:penicillin-binding protein 2
MLVRKRYQPTFRPKKRIEIERMADKKRPRSPERTIDQIRLSRRTLVFKGLALGSFAALTGRLYQLQVTDRQTLIAQQQEGSRRDFPLPAARGLIYDRNRKPLADNIKSWSVAVVPANLPDDETDAGKLERQAIYVTLANQLAMPDVVIVRPSELYDDAAKRQETYTRLAAALGVPVENVRDHVEAEIAKAEEEKRAPQRSIRVPDGTTDLRPEQLAAARTVQPELQGVHIVNPIDYQVAIYGAWKPYEPLIIKPNVDKGVALGIEANRLYLPGVQVDDNTLSRRYLVGEEMGHILGYTGPITAEEWIAKTVKDERGQTALDSDGDPIRIYKNKDFIGKAGVEAGLEEILRGQPGHYGAKVNALNKVIGELPGVRVNPVNGKSVVLSIPLDYQQEVIKILSNGYNGVGGINNVEPYINEENEKALRENPPRPDRIKPIPPKAGSAVAIDPRTGEILALVSLPGYDVKLFAEGISQKDFDLLLEKDIPDEQKRYPLQNRCIASQYPPGSTLKTFVASAGLHSGKIKHDTKFKCLGHIRVPPLGNEIGGNNYWCWTRDNQHQDMNIYEALATSCDVFFYTMAGPKQTDLLGVNTHFYHPNSADPQWFDGIGINSLNDHLRLYGFGALTGIELGDEIQGLVPGIEWKEQNYENDYWSLGDTLNTSIGQGYMQVTPLQLCNATAAVANGGTLYRPTIIHEILDDAGNVVRGPEPQAVRKLPIDRNLLEIVREGMRMNVTWHRQDGRFPPYQVKGLVAPDFDPQGAPIPRTEQFPLPPGIDAGVKTGTAEYGTKRDDDGLLLQSHAWCAAFAPYDNPEICVLAFVEGGQASAKIAAPVACGMINAWFARKERG